MQDSNLRILNILPSSSAKHETVCSLEPDNRDAFLQEVVHPVDSRLRPPQVRRARGRGDGVPLRRPALTPSPVTCSLTWQRSVQCGEVREPAMGGLSRTVWLGPGRLSKGPYQTEAGPWKQDIGVMPRRGPEPRSTAGSGNGQEPECPEAPGGTCPASTLSPGLATSTSFSRCVSSH